jgi:hypothetical protein
MEKRPRLLHLIGKTQPRELYLKRLPREQVIASLLILCSVTTTQKSTSSPADGVSTSLPLCNPQSRCRYFPALLQSVLVSLSSRIKPLLEMRFEALVVRKSGCCRFEPFMFSVHPGSKLVTAAVYAVFRTIRETAQNEIFLVAISQADS